MTDRHGSLEIGPLTDVFAHRIGGPPTRLVRAPGRINLIGDHVDYNDLPVLPMAIQHEITMHVRPRDDAQVRLENVDPVYEPVAFNLGATITADAAGHWANYPKAAAQALVRAFGPLAGFDGLVHGTIPQAAGLSSSSALVVAAALALIDANDLAIDRRSLMALLADAEHYVGTRGGGMDQAICLGATPGTATRIDFRPLRLTSVPVPGDWRFVVAFSGVRAHKSAEAREVYNRRTQECSEAIAVLADELGLEEDARHWRTLLNVAPFDELISGLAGVLDAPLDRRARHVLTEAARVDAAVAEMKAGDATAFGKLMLASHESLRDDYEVSGPELDALVSLAVEAGAAGARLTGAGFGGSVVALVTPEAGTAVLEAWADGFHRPRGLTGAAFVAEPAGAAGVVPIAG
jgi:galactokinase